MTNDVELKVWWVPQVPMKRFEVAVTSVDEGRKFCLVLAEYDLFQYENNIKPDYCSAGGLIFRNAGLTGDEWWDVPDDEDEWRDILADIAEAEKARESAA